MQWVPTALLCLDVPSDMMEYNETDLVQACHEAGFTTTHRGLGAETLYAILEGTTQPPDQRPECRMEVHRTGMADYVSMFALQIRSQLGCDVDCANCKDPILGECTVFNWELTHKER